MWFIRMWSREAERIAEWHETPGNRVSRLHNKQISNQERSLELLGSMVMEVGPLEGETFPRRSLHSSKRIENEGGAEGEIDGDR